MFDELLSAIIKGLFRFLGWLFIEILFELVIEPFIYACGKHTLRVMTLGQYRLENPSRLAQSLIYSTGVISLIAGGYLLLRIIKTA